MSAVQSIDQSRSEASAAAATSHGRIGLVEVARGLAALAVAMLHAATGMVQPQYSGEIGMGGIFRLGFLGVDFFFVLSGFIICYVHFADIGHAEKLKRYGWRRVVRIFPTYWIIFALLLTFNLLVQSTKAQISGPGWFIGELLMVKDHLWIGVAWTLQHELIFYCLFAVLVFHRTAGLLVIGLWMASILLVHFVYPDFHAYTFTYLTPPNPRIPWQVILHPINFDFLFGMMVGWCARKLPGRLSFLMFGFALVFVLLGQFYFHWQDFDWNGYARYPWVGTGFAALLCLILLTARHIKSVPAPVTFLGTISYSLYLSHGLPISITFAILAKLGLYQQLPGALIFCVSILAAVGFAGLCFYFLENPVIKKLQKLVP